MTSPHLLISIDPMCYSDIPRVMELDSVSFPSPWMRESYVTELGNRAAQYFVARNSQGIVGYGGLWVIDHLAHITTLAVEPQNRRNGIGERLLLELLYEACLRKASRIELEVRIGNTAARRLYERYRFTQADLRPRYYSDNGEDALIMRVSDADDPEFNKMLWEASERTELRRFGSGTLCLNENLSNDESN